MTIHIRPVQDHTEYHAIEEVQRQAWGTADVSIVPANIMIATHKNGGLVLGAFDTSAATADTAPTNAPLIGFVFGFLGQTSSGKIKHCSHMAGVLPAYQNMHIGYRLKCVQRTHVLAQSFDLITWTFDPLESRNAYFNLRKLGTTASTYLRNVYGPDPFAPGGAGLPSDRFQADWHLNSRRVHSRLRSNPTIPLLSDVRARSVPLINPTPPDTPPDESLVGAAQLLVQIPGNFRAVKQQDSDLARRWRQHTRTIFEMLFANGYVATELLVEQQWSYYLLEKSNRL